MPIDHDASENNATNYGSLASDLARWEDDGGQVSIDREECSDVDHRPQ